MVAISSPTGLDGVIASGNTPLWIVQDTTLPEPLNDQAASFPLTALSAADTVKADCHMNMDGFEMSREATTRERQRMCEKIAKKVKTGETIDGSVTAIFDQQAESAALINAVYDALAEGNVVYIVRAYGLDANQEPVAGTKVDVYRVDVQQRNKNQPVQGEDLMFTATVSGDLYLQDIPLA